MPSISINAEDIFYERRGESAGAPLVFVHGAGNTHAVWSKQMAALQNCTAYALDLPGHGQSTGAGRDNVAGYGEVLLGFLDGMLPASAVIAGHSLGGAIALWLAIHKPARVRGLVLVSTGARLRVHPNMLRAARDGRAITRAVLDEQPPAERPTLEAQAGANVTYGDWLACDRFDLMDRVHEDKRRAHALTVAIVENVFGVNRNDRHIQLLYFVPDERTRRVIFASCCRSNSLAR